MGASNELIARLNLAYVLADMLESCMMLAEELAKRETGQRLEMEQKRYFNAALHNVRMMRKAMNKSNGQEQEDFGNDCDMMLAFLWLLVDRCGEDDKRLFKFYEYIKSFPSVMGFPLMDENEVFGHIFSKKGVGN
jgi:hypothetical protein